jgi:hypothetical protein
VNKVYFSCWSDYAEMRKDFDMEFNATFPRPDQILFASYGQYSYEGDAVVIYRGDDGKLYEVQGGHCSCYGLEGQWTPDEVLPAQLAMRGNSFLSGHDADAKAAYWALVEELKGAFS